MRGRGGQRVAGTKVAAVGQRVEINDLLGFVAHEQDAVGDRHVAHRVLDLAAVVEAHPKSAVDTVHCGGQDIDVGQAADLRAT